jgi:(S)-ureidoglycine-glyoxylate aminotransferase
MAPVTYNERAERKVLARKRIERGLLTTDAGAGGSGSPDISPIRSNYLDLAQLQDYWSPARLNHHTEMTSMLYGLREGLRILHQEGLEARFARHRLQERALMAGLAAMGLSLYGDPACKLPVVTCVNIPEGVDGEAVRGMLLNLFGIEIASSFGPLKGRIWRIGTMGYSASRKNVLHLLGALEAVLIRHGVKLPAGEGLQAAMAVYEQEAPQ